MLLSRLLRKMAERGEEIRTVHRAKYASGRRVWLSFDVAVRKKSAIEPQYSTALPAFGDFKTFYLAVEVFLQPLPEQHFESSFELTL